MTSHRLTGAFRADLASMALIGAGSSFGCMAIYQAEGGTGNGYAEVRLNDDTVKVVYTGHPSTRPERREAFFCIGLPNLPSNMAMKIFLSFSRNLTHINMTLAARERVLTSRAKGDCICPHGYTFFTHG